MARYTRNSYKRKIIMFGIMLFVSIALISTGFATWVLSTQSKKEDTGNVIVGAVTDASFEITFDETVGDLNFIFEPKQGDESGRVRADKTGPWETLSITITGKITQYEYLGSFTVKMDISDDIKKLVTDKYIVAPACANAAVELTTTAGAITPNEDGTANFTYTITFAWGEKFGGMNPSEYYDTDPTGMAVEDSVVKSTLQTFHSLMDTTADPAKNNQFKITFTATAK